MQQRKFPMKQVNTGQKFPDGIQFEHGECEQCGRIGLTTVLDIQPGGSFGAKFAPDADVHVLKICCAECMADFVMAPMCKVFGSTTTGEHKEIKAMVGKGSRR
jgi:hypothetical protein